MSDLADFLANSGDEPYRKFIQHHLRRQTTYKLQMGCTSTTELLPKKAQSHVIEFIDGINSRIGYDKHFWNYGDVRTAFGFIIQEAVKHLPIHDWITCEADAYKPENHELAFNIFQIASLSFAYSASLTRKQRKFMGIRKGLFR